MKYNTTKQGYSNWMWRGYGWKLILLVLTLLFAPGAFIGMTFLSYLIFLIIFRNETLIQNYKKGN